MNTAASTHPHVHIGPFGARSAPRSFSPIPRPATGSAHLTLADWIRDHATCSDIELHHVVASLVAHCSTLQRATGRSHGALCPAAIALGDFPARRLTHATIEIAPPPASTATATRDAVELADLRAIGEIVLQLVEGRLVEPGRAGARAMRMGEAWRGLGRRADFWFLFCHQLLDTNLTLASASLATLALEFPLRRRQPVFFACALASGALALGSVALYLAPPPAGDAPRQAIAPAWEEVAPAPDPGPAHMTSGPALSAGVDDGETVGPAAAAAGIAFVPLTIEARPGSLAGLIDAYGTFTSVGVVDPLGRLARDLLLPAGEYELTLEHHRYASVRQHVVLRPGQPVALSPAQHALPGSLRILSTPAGAEVRVNGIHAGTTPLLVENQPADAELSITVALAGHEPAARALVLGARELRVLDFGRLTQATEPVADRIEPASTPVGAAARAAAASFPDIPPEAAPALATRPTPEPSARGPHAGRTWTVSGLDLEMIWIGPGEFLFGSPANETGRRAGEFVQVAARVDTGFWIGRREVSRAHYAAVMGSRPSAFSRGSDDAPVEQVSWDDALEFCRRLTERERRAGRLPPGMAYTLPDEVQWEYACRAGTTTAWPGTPELMAWFDRNSRRQPRAPGEKLPVPDPFGTSDSGPARFIPHMRAQLPNNWGLHDMIGNVAEWCRPAPGYAPAGDGQSVARGGGWRSPLSELRSAHRVELPRDTRRADVGFRLALVTE